MGWFDWLTGGSNKAKFGDSDEIEPEEILLEAAAFEAKSGHIGLESAGGPELWYPQADRSVAMRTRGPYRQGYPLGAVIHYTAGRYEKGDDSARATMRYGADSYAFFCISTTGKVFQGAPLNVWGSHAGQSAWPGLGPWVSQHLVGIEICSAGLLENKNGRLMPWWGNPPVPQDQAREVGVAENINQAGWYHAYTKAQEDALTDLLIWLKMNNPSVFNLDYVLGHDEVATPQGRKNDPGGALSMSMPTYRMWLQARIGKFGGPPHTPEQPMA